MNQLDHAVTDDHASPAVRERGEGRGLARQRGTDFETVSIVPFKTLATHNLGRLNT